MASYEQNIASICRGYGGRQGLRIALLRAAGAASPHLTKRRAARKLCAMNFRAVRISLIITIIPKMVG